MSTALSCLSPSIRAAGGHGQLKNAHPSVILTRAASAFCMRWVLLRPSQDGGARHIVHIQSPQCKLPKKTTKKYLLGKEHISGSSGAFQDLKGHHGEGS
jgi:hypothetical protein